MNIDRLSLTDIAQILGLSERPEAQTDPCPHAPALTLRDEANAITAFAFRNSFLEDLHAGQHSPWIEDDSLSRITDQEMKKLMIESSAKISRCLYLRDQLPRETPSLYGALIASYGRMYCRDWQRTEVEYTMPPSAKCAPCSGCGNDLHRAWRFCPQCAAPEPASTR